MKQILILLLLSVIKLTLVSVHCTPRASDIKHVVKQDRESKQWENYLKTSDPLVILEENEDSSGRDEDEQNSYIKINLPTNQKTPRLTKDHWVENSASSGARSAFPMTPFGDPFNLFNFFNVFRSPKTSSDTTHSENNVNLMLFEKSPLSGSSDKSENMFNSSLHYGTSKSKFRSVYSSRTSSEGENRNHSTPNSPVILVPGYGGSRLEAKWDKPSVVRYFCERQSDWTDMWINVKQLLPYMIDCLIDNMRLEFDYSTNKTRNTPGVEVRVKTNATNQLASVEYLNDLPISGFAYFASVIEQLVDRLNYERELSVRGAPYDFRKAPNELTEYFENLKEFSEQTYLENKQKPITYICHSMGCNNMLYFLQHQSKDWKRTYVRRLISIAAPWAGSMSALRAAALGDDLGMPYLFSGSKLIRVQRSLPSTIYLFPHSKAFANVPLIKSNIRQQKTVMNENQENMKQTTSQQERVDELLQKTYQAQDFKSFFEDINHPDGYQIWLNTKDLLGSLDAPQVEVWCLVGKGHKTLGRLEYSGEFPDSSSLELFDDGDGTVTLQSASYCKHWINEQEQPIHYREIDSSHMEILKNPQILTYIENILHDP